MKIKKLVFGMTLATLVSVCSTGCSSASGNASKTQVNLGKYKGVEIKALSTEVSDEELKESLDSYLEGVKLEDPANTTVEKGETVNVDYKGMLDGKAFEGGTATDQEITVGAGGFIDGFEDGMVGIKVGETKTINATFPDEYSANEELSGKTVQFEIKVNYIYKDKVSELTDEIVAQDTTSAYSDCKTVEELKTAVKEDIKEEKKTESENAKISTVINTIINDTEFIGLDQKEVQEYYEEIYVSYESQAQMYSVDMESYVSLMGYTLDDFKDACYEMAEANVKANLVFDKIAEVDNISLTDEEYNSRIADILKQYTMQGMNYTEKEMVEEYGGEAEVRELFLREKVRNYIVDSAVVKEEVTELENIEYELTTKRQEIDSSSKGSNIQPTRQVD